MTIISSTAIINAIRVKEQGSSPSTPASGYGLIFEKSDGKLYFLNDAGLEVELGPNGVTALNSMTGQVAVQGGAGVAVAAQSGNVIQLTVDAVIQIACSDESTALTTGTAKVTFRMPFALTLTAVRASLSTAQTSGSTLTVDINEGGSTILSTKLTIDNTEKTSTTAATPPVISDTALADDAEITIDIDTIGDGTAKGLKVTLIGTRA